MRRPDDQVAKSSPSRAAGKPLTTTGAPTTLPIQTLPSASTSASGSSAGLIGTILMIKLYVGDLNAAKAFYGGAFGAKPALAIGDNANILTFPRGGPGLVPLKSNPGDEKFGGRNSPDRLTSSS